MKENFKLNKNPVYRHFVNVLVDRIKVNGLPKEIDQYFFLYYVLLYGRILLFKKETSKDVLYHAYWYGGGGHKNEYHIQDEYIVTNPWLPKGNESIQLDNENAVIIYSDIQAYLFNADLGLNELVEKYANIVSTIDRSIEIIAKNSRLLALLTGSDNTFISSARKFVKQAFDNDEAFLFMEESLVDAIKTNPLTDKMEYKLSELVKTRQYYISDFYQKIGIGANQNMKKERLTDDESEMVENVASVDFNHIINYLNFSASRANEFFGLNIKFEINEEKEDKEDKEDKKDGTDDKGNKEDTKKSSERDLGTPNAKGDDNDERKA